MSSFFIALDSEGTTQKNDDTEEGTTQKKGRPRRRDDLEEGTTQEKRRFLKRLLLKGNSQRDDTERYNFEKETLPKDTPKKPRKEASNTLNKKIPNKEKKRYSETRSEGTSKTIRLRKRDSKRESK